MTTEQHRDPYESMTPSEQGALRAVAFLFQQSKDFRGSGGSIQGRMLSDLGLSARQVAYVLDILQRLHRTTFDSDLKQETLLPPRSCPIIWMPTVLTPVFWGREHVLAGSVQIPTTIYYPSLDGSPDGAQMLRNCGKYPLILFLHGHCASEDDHLVKWERHLAQLARSGFVVAAPFFSWRNIVGGPTQDSVLNHAVAVVLWMRGIWPHGDQLLPSHHMGVFGHSYGGMLACRYATSQTVGAYASLNVGWHEWNEFGSGLSIPLFALSVPSLHVWGTGGTFSDAIEGSDWDAIPTPKHRVVLEGGDHWVYLQGTSGGCAPSSGGCKHLGAVAGDLLAGFFARYLPPVELDIAGASIPLSLVPPAVPLTFEQEFYAGGHLMGLKMLPYSDGCKITSHWNSEGSSGAITLSSP